MLRGSPGLDSHITNPPKNTYFCSRTFFFGFVKILRIDFLFCPNPFRYAKLEHIRAAQQILHQLQMIYGLHAGINVRICAGQHANIHVRALGTKI